MRFQTLLVLLVLLLSACSSSRNQNWEGPRDSFVPIGRISREVFEGSIQIDESNSFLRKSTRGDLFYPKYFGTPHLLAGEQYWPITGLPYETLEATEGIGDCVTLKAGEKASKYLDPGYSAFAVEERKGSHLRLFITNQDYVGINDLILCETRAIALSYLKNELERSDFINYCYVELMYGFRVNAWTCKEFRQEAASGPPKSCSVTYSFQEVSPSNTGVGFEGNDREWQYNISLQPYECSSNFVIEYDPEGVTLDQILFVQEAFDNYCSIRSPGVIYCFIGKKTFYEGSFHMFTNGEVTAYIE